MAKTLLELGNRDCRFPLWPNGEKPDAAAPFCGCPTDLGESYCADHKAKAMSPPLHPISLKGRGRFKFNAKGRGGLS